MVAINFGGHLITGQRLTGMEGGRIFTQAFVRNVRGCLLMRCESSARISATGDHGFEAGGSDCSTTLIQSGKATSGVGLSHSSENVPSTREGAKGLGYFK